MFDFYGSAEKKTFGKKVFRNLRENDLGIIRCSISVFYSYHKNLDSGSVSLNPSLKGQFLSKFAKKIISKIHALKRR